MSSHDDMPPIADLDTRGLGPDGEPARWPLSADLADSLSRLSDWIAVPALRVSDLPVYGKAGHAIVDHEATANARNPIDDALGGGVRPRQLVIVAAPQAKGGKTTLAMQIADGLALHTAMALANDSDGGRYAVDARAPLTPVVILSEMDRVALDKRTIARWTDTPAPSHRVASGDLLEKAKALLHDPLAVAAFSHRHVIENALEVATQPDVEARLRATVDGVRESLRSERGVIPVVIVDPLHRFAPRFKPDTDGRDRRLDGIDRDDEAAMMARRVANACGASVWVTTDATKASAQEHGSGSASAVRGSYTLLHLADAAIRVDSVTEGEKADWLGKDKTADQAQILISSDHARDGRGDGGVRYAWKPGLFSIGKPLGVRVPQ
jgi:hypothetical protein